MKQLLILFGIIAITINITVFIGYVIYKLDKYNGFVKKQNSDFTYIHVFKMYDFNYNEVVLINQNSNPDDYKEEIVFTKEGRVLNINGFEFVYQKGLTLVYKKTSTNITIQDDLSELKDFRVDISITKKPQP